MAAIHCLRRSLNGTWVYRSVHGAAWSLAYPCSIAQLLAILAMALVRALVRRRLGRTTTHYPAFERFEVDSLAIRLVYYPDRQHDDAGPKKNPCIFDPESAKKML